MINTESKLNTLADKRIAYAYLRVSTTDQKEGNSIDVQKKYAEKFSTKQNLGKITYFEETKSASKVQTTNFDIASDLYKSLDNRPELQKIIKHAQQKKFTDLIVYSRDRLARNLEMQIALNFFFSKNNIRVHFTKPGEGYLSDNDRLSNFFNIVLGSVAELEANLIASRVKAGQEQCIRSGVWAGGRLPYGYEFKEYGKKNHTLSPLVLEKIYIQEIFKLYTHHGYSYRRIADELNKEWGNGREVWTKRRVESIITNEVYTGYIVWNRRSRENENNTQSRDVRSQKYLNLEFINRNQWENANNIRLNKSSIRDPKYYNTPFLLRDKLVCTECNTPMKPKNYGKERGSIYRCDVAKGHKPHLIISKDLVEKVFLANFISSNLPINIKNYWHVYKYQIDIKQNNDEQNLVNIITYLPKIESTITKIDTIIKDIDLEVTSLTIQLNEKKAEITKATNKKSKKDLSEELKDLQEYLNIETTIRDDLLSEKTNLINIKNEHLKNKNLLENRSNNYFENQNELQMALEQFFDHDFFKLDDIRKRMIIDMLVDKVSISKDVQSSEGFKMEILFKKP